MRRKDNINLDIRVFDGDVKIGRIRNNKDDALKDLERVLKKFA